MMIPVEDLAGLPSWTCQHPQGDDVRHFAGQAGGFEQGQLTPGGLPLACCHVKFAGWGPGPSSSPAPTAYRSGRR
jgi:hypothetical protein